MQPVRLRFEPPATAPELALDVGMHHIGRVGDGLGVVDEGESIVCFCVDRRGVWLTVGDSLRGVHVNGREVLRLAMLRAGDSVYVEGQEIRLLGSRAAEAPLPVERDAPDCVTDPRVVLRGLGGRHHGRCFTLDAPRLVGRVSAADIRIDDPAFAERHARLELVDGKVRLHDLGSAEGSLVNGEQVRDAVLWPGDQLVFDGNDRFVVEAPLRRARPAAPPLAGAAAAGAGLVADAGGAGARAWWRLPLVLLAALLIAGLLSLLLLYGAG